ncbi:MAG: hypothetical protein AAFW95_00790 [Cyanobacteria bacterium J06638_6]
MSSAAMVLAVVVPLGIWALVLMFVLAILLAVSDGLRRLERLHQVPCFRCRYYTNSPYLKCPVRPIEAGSEAALYCNDYEPAAPSPGQSPLTTRLDNQMPSNSI